MFDISVQSPPDSGPTTRDRIINAAGQVFAERGFRDSTVREICALADANVASVNYHFGDKEHLYAAVLRDAHQAAEQRHPFASDFHTLTPDERLRLFILLMLRRMLDKGKPAWFGKLMAREMTEPTVALDALVAHTIRPKSEVLRTIVRDVLGTAGDEQLVAALARSVIGQCLFYHQNRAMVERLFTDVEYHDAGIDAIADHVATFSLDAIHAAARRARGGASA